MTETEFEQKIGVARISYLTKKKLYDSVNDKRNCAHWKQWRGSHSLN